MKYLKPCKNCNSQDRYKNGACKPCAVKKQQLRNRQYMLPSHIEIQKRTLLNSEIKNVAKRNNQSHYESLTPCSQCGEKIRYVCNGGCIGCN